MWRVPLLGGLVLMSLTVAGAKSEPTYYTPERVAIGRDNLARYTWAQDLFKRIRAGDRNDYYIGREYGSATDCLAQSDDFVWLMQPTTAIPRRPPNHETQGLCPVHGDAPKRTSAWTAWTTDPIHHPYKVRCHAGGEWYPSNDFMNGDLTSGEFPDDGSGCLYQGKRYYFLREYAHMAYGNNTIPCLRSLSQAWLLTGDKGYARKGCILLARLAAEYPNFTDRQDRLFYALYGGRDPYYTWKTGGMITDLIWETFCLEATAYAYDGLWEYMGQDPELIQFLKGKGMPIESGDDLRRYIEENLLRVGMEGLLNGHIHGNEGHHQAAALACALVMDDYGPDRSAGAGGADTPVRQAEGTAPDKSVRPTGKDMVDYAFHGIGRGAWITINGLTTDGGGNESPNYSLIKLDFIRVNQLMEAVRGRQPELFPTDRYPDLFGNPKGRAIFDYYLDIMVNNDAFPSIGDCGGVSTPPTRRVPRCYAHPADEMLYAVERFHDPRYARACTFPDGRLVTGRLFEAYPEAEIRALLARPESRIRREPRLLDGYGVAIVESGEYPKHHALALNYTSIVGHRQYDNLNLEVWARGVDLLPDLGYPVTWDHRWEWDAATMSHTTVTVNETSAASGRGGVCNLFASAGGVHVVSARHDPYPPGTEEGRQAPGVDLYERTTVMVDVGPDSFYVVDLFAANGGDLRTQSWHGPPTRVQSPALDWAEQPTGTLAGPEVSQFAKYTDRWGRTRASFPSYLGRIRKTMLTEPAAWTWEYGLPEGDRTSLHLVPVGGPMEVVVGTGRSPARPEDWGLDYVLAQRPGGDGPSHFVTVIDSYQKTPLVQGVRLVTANPLVLHIVREGGVDEVTLATPSGPSRTHQHRALGVRLVSREGERAARDVRIGDYSEASAPGYEAAVIREVDYDARRIAMGYTADRAACFQPGRYLRIFNNRRSGMFRVTEARREGERLVLTLDHTALLGQGPVVKVADGRLWITAFLDWTLSSNTPDGELIPQAGGDYFDGAWLGEGSKARQVRGAVRDMPSEVFFAQEAPAAELEKDYGGQVISLWQYGVGDRVEAPRIR